MFFRGPDRKKPYLTVVYARPCALAAPTEEKGLDDSSLLLCHPLPINPQQAFDLPLERRAHQAAITALYGPLGQSDKA
jgi:hypothetical protein